MSFLKWCLGYFKYTRFLLVTPGEDYELTFNKGRCILIGRVTHKLRGFELEAVWLDEAGK